MALLAGQAVGLEDFPHFFGFPLRYYLDLTEAQIAETLGCSPGTVKSTASDALKALRRNLAPAEGAQS